MHTHLTTRLSGKVFDSPYYNEDVDILMYICMHYNFRDVPRFWRVVVIYLNGFYISKTVIFNFYAPTMLMRFLVDTTYVVHMCCVKQLAIKINFFHSCWYFFISQWVCSGGCFIWVVAILSEWWLVLTTVGTSLWYKCHKELHEWPVKYVCL